MNGIKYLIDTCTLIGLQKQSTQSLELLSNKQAFINECAISIVTYMEFVGFYGTAVIYYPLDRHACYLNIYQLRNYFSS